MSLGFRMPKEADMDLWIDNLGFYRKKALAADNDGGADAPQTAGSTGLTERAIAERSE